MDKDREKDVIIARKNKDLQRAIAEINLLSQEMGKKTIENERQAREIAALTARLAKWEVSSLCSKHIDDGVTGRQWLIEQEAADGQEP